MSRKERDLSLEGVVSEEFLTFRGLRAACRLVSVDKVRGPACLQRGRTWLKHRLPLRSYVFVYVRESKSLMIRLLNFIH